MPRVKAVPAGIGAKGECLKRFIHPKNKRNKLWPVDEKLRVPDIEIVDKSEKRVGKKHQKVYDIRVPGHRKVALYVVCCHFSVKVAAGTPFEDEIRAPPAAAAEEGGGRGQGPERQENPRASTDNFTHPNMSRGADAEDIARLRDQGI